MLLFLRPPGPLRRVLSFQVPEMPIRPPQHRPAGWRPPAQVEADRQRDYNKRRDPRIVGMYKSRQWQAARKAHLAREPLCRACAADGRVTAATDVDHILPHKGDWHLFLSGSNLQSLCRSCHSRKTATEDSGFARGGSTMRPGCDATGMPLDPRHPWRA